LFDLGQLVATPVCFAKIPCALKIVRFPAAMAASSRSPLHQGNLEVERGLGGHMAASVGYIYSHGLALLGNSNAVTRQANGNFGLDLNLVPPSQQPAFGGNFSTATVTLPSGNSYVVPEFEAIDGILDPDFGAINAVDNSGKSIYHALLLSWRYTAPQFTGGCLHRLQNGRPGTGYFNHFDQRNQRGPSQLDQPQRFVLNGAWSPAWHPLKNFTFASVVTLASGRPYTAVFDTSSLNFSVVPDEPFNGFRGPGQEVSGPFNERKIVVLRSEPHAKPLGRGRLRATVADSVLQSAGTEWPLAFSAEPRIDTPEDQY